ncbi:malto-oligosyltrehalose trehalohydrolase [Citreimonas sp.]|uniref:malto-oligosyltrehalose trehalohydrolase n=1 Tax=Citreimonas sp. TaxID=3036715 RepID=UPI0035C8173A
MTDTAAPPAHFWGARPAAGDTWDFALWAPDAGQVALRLHRSDVALERSDDGVWRGRHSARAGDRYGFVVDGTFVPDPASRRQDGSVHDASILVEPDAADTRGWSGRDWAEAAILEIHVGTFTEEGTFAAAARHLPALAETGITMVELMPVAQFAGDRGWGYDGVLPFAPHPAYGTPEDLKDFVAAAHRAGIGVLMDVVYNHFGPEGAYLHVTSPRFFDEGTDTPWGSAIDYSLRPVREFALQNAEMWVRDYGFDGLRLDAVHAIVDPGTPHLITEMAERLRALRLGRLVHLVTEDERNLPVFQDEGTAAATWNDDYHHAVHALTTGEADSYYAPFAVDPMCDLVTALERGQVDEGQPRRNGKPRGAPSGHLPPTAFVNANQTHDQIGNRAQGDRLIALIGPDPMRVLHALLLTSPYIPMLFMGEEIGARTPFRFFVGFEGDLADAVRKGRAEEFKAFASFGGDVPDPVARDTFSGSRPYDDPPEDAADWNALTRTLLRHRAEKVVPLLRSGRVEAGVGQTGPRALRALWRFEAGQIETVAALGTPHDPMPGADLILGAPGDNYGFATKVTFT